MLTKAILVPSGDHAGKVSLVVLSLESIVCPDPSAFMTQMVSLPSITLEKAIFLPSGDQAGLQVLLAPVFVRRICPDPSAFMA
jgi:hypothetical protein